MVPHNVNSLQFLLSQVCICFAFHFVVLHPKNTHNLIFCLNFGFVTHCECYLFLSPLNLLISIILGPGLIHVDNGCRHNLNYFNWRKFQLFHSE